MWRCGPLPGLIAGTVALIGWAWALFGPTVRYSTIETRTDTGSAVTESGWSSVWASEDLQAVTVAFFLVMLLSVIGMLVGALLHGRWRLSAGRPLLWVSAIILLLGALLSMSIGLLLLPGAILGIVAAALAGSPPDRRRTTASAAR